MIDMVFLKSSTDFTKCAEQSKLVINHLCGFITTESASSMPRAKSRSSGQISAEPAQAASTCENRPSARAIGRISVRRSLTPTPVLPSKATTAHGIWPAARSASMAACNASAFIAPSSSASIFTRLSRPIPDRNTAFSTEECAWLLA